MWNLKKMVQMNLFAKQKQSHRCRKQSSRYQGKGGGVVNWEIEIDRHTLLYIKQVTSEDLVYSTGNSAQYSILMTYMGKESYKREWIYVYG